MEVKVCVEVAVGNSCGGVGTIRSDDGLTLLAIRVQQNLLVSMHQVKVGVVVAAG